MTSEIFTFKLHVLQSDKCKYFNMEKGMGLWKVIFEGALLWKTESHIKASRHCTGVLTGKKDTIWGWHCTWHLFYTYLKFILLSICKLWVNVYTIVYIITESVQSVFLF